MTLSYHDTEVMIAVQTTSPGHSGKLDFCSNTKVATVTFEILFTRHGKMHQTRCWYWAF
jgi:hypothetical protein